jgi:hypothetical protein
MTPGHHSQSINSERAESPYTALSLGRASVLFVTSVSSFIGASLLLASL